MTNNNFVRTLNFGCVPIRKNPLYTDGKHYADIELSDVGDDAVFAEIRLDFRTNQPFAVLFDGNWNQL